MVEGYSARSGEPLTVKCSGGWLSLFGLPFLLVGSIFLVIAYSLFSSLYAPVFILGLGLFFVLAGVLLVLFREKIIIDGRASLLICEKWLVIQVARKVRRVDGYTAVTLREVVADDRKSEQGKFQYEVQFTADGVHRRPLLIERFDQHGKAVSTGMDLSRYLGWQFVDLSAIPQAEAVSEVCLASSWCQHKPPARTKLVQRVTDHQAEVFLPAAGYAVRERQYLIFACLWPAFVVLAFLLPVLQGVAADSFNHAWFVTFILLLFVVLAVGPTMWAGIGAIRSATTQCRVLVDQRRLSVQQRWLFGESNEMIAVSDRLCVRQGQTERHQLLPGLFVWPALWLVDGNTRVAIASRVLTQEDLEWLAGLVRHFQQEQETS